MTSNNGVLGTYHFGGERAATGDHPAVMYSGSKQASVSFATGLLLARDDDGTLVPYDGDNTLVGVCDEPCDSGITACDYLIHGTVKSRLLARGDGTAATAEDKAALIAIGIYPV